jgi:hypothetical protein
MKRSWFLERRLDYIDWRLIVNGSIRRADLMRIFGISQPQASADLNLFLRLYRGAMDYDLSAKKYVMRLPYRSRRGLNMAAVDSLRFLFGDRE